MAQAVLRLCPPLHDEPVPVEEIALALDIGEVRRARLRGFEGMLLTDRVRSTGAILANDSHGREARVRFTIAHELGHFLLEHHQFHGDTGFACSAADMGVVDGRDRHVVQESEANRFAIGLLAPPARFASLLDGPPDITSVHALAGDLQISREAALRRLVTLHPEPMAVVFARDDVISVAPRHPRFPWLRAIKGHALPIDLPLPDTPGENHTDWFAAPDGSWCAPSAATVLQQAHVSEIGFVTILLRLADRR